MDNIYDDEKLQEVSDKVNLLEYVSKTVNLIEKGNEFWGHCPLHTDKTPSFSVRPSTNQFYCFGCGCGGGIIQFLYHYENLTYIKAIEKAFILADMDISKMCQSKTVLYNKQLKKMSSISQTTVCHKILPKTEIEKYQKQKVEAWLDEGIRQSEIDLFNVRIDTRSNRIVYPVYDMSNNLINIKGRTMFKDFKKLNISKYINYYPVGVVDYFQGANITLPYIEDTGELKLFESVKSVMKLFGHGTKDSVSAEKHTLTPEQIKWIVSNKKIKNVVFCYDSDVTYSEKVVAQNINTLKRFLNVYVVYDKKGLLGGKEGKNAPIDLGIDIWNELYKNRTKIL